MGNKKEQLNILKKKGIFSQGFGQVYRFVMEDPSLTLEAKAIYAYLCSFMGGGSFAFPGWDKIVSDLNVNKDTYYKHLGKLLERGYIYLEKEVSSSGRFSHNIYYLNSDIKDLNIPYDEVLQDSIAYSGLAAFGYGNISKLVMTDDSLKIKAKGIYAYYASLTGGGKIPCPSKDTVLKHTGISHNTLDKCNRQLMEKGYLTVKQRSDASGKFSCNDYILNVSLDETLREEGREDLSNKPQPKFSEAVKSEPHTSFSEMEVSEPQPKTSEARTSFSEANKYYNIKNDIHSITHSVDDSNESENNNALFDQFLRDASIPAGLLYDKVHIEKAVRVMTDFEKFGNPETYARFSDGDLQYSVYMLFIDCLSEMLTDGQGTKYKGTVISAAEVLNKLNRYISLYKGRPLLDVIKEVAVDNFKAACKTKKITDPAAYMKACIWDALKIGNIQDLYGL